MDYNLTYCGRSVPSGVRIVDIMLDAPQVKMRTLDLPGRNGLIHAGNKFGSRIVTIKFRLFNGSIDADMTAYSALMAWAAGDDPSGFGELKLPGMGNWHLDAKCTQLPALRIHQEGEEIPVEFTAVDPFWKTDRNYSVSFTPGNTFSVSVMGNIDTPFSIETSITAYSSTKSTITIAVNGTTVISCYGSFRPGVLRLDTETGELWNVDSFMQAAVNAGSDMNAKLKAGINNTVKITASGCTLASGYLYQRDRKL